MPTQSLLKPADPIRERFQCRVDVGSQQRFVLIDGQARQRRLAHELGR
jgi:hypothetical protein